MLTIVFNNCNYGNKLSSVKDNIDTLDLTELCEYARIIEIIIATHTIFHHYLIITTYQLSHIHHIVQHHTIIHAKHLFTGPKQNTSAPGAA